MATTTRNITLDVARPNLIPSISAKQFDADSRFINVTITEMGETIVIDADSVVLFNVTSPNGTSASYSGSVNEDGTVHITIPNQALSVDGTLFCSVSIIKENARLTTLHFTIVVEGAESTAEPSENELDVWTEALSDIAVLKSENIRITNDIAMLESENTRITNELNKALNGVGYTANLTPNDSNYIVQYETLGDTRLVVQGAVITGSIDSADVVTPTVTPFSDEANTLKLYIENEWTDVSASLEAFVAYVEEHTASAIATSIIRYGDNDLAHPAYRYYGWFFELDIRNLSTEEIELIKPQLDTIVNDTRNAESIKWVVPSQTINEELHNI